MSDTLVLHPYTERLVAQFSAAPGHALLISGAYGAGKVALAKHISETILGVDDVTKYPYWQHIAPVDDGGSITIEQVRGLQTFAKLKVPSTRTTARIAFIEDADVMTGEAQNALLKLLEEPPADTLIILTSANTDGLLPTVRSRVQQIDILRPTLVAAMRYFESHNFAASDKKKAYHMCNGQMGLMQAVLNGSDHPLLHYIAEAKALLQAPMFERLIQVDVMTKQKKTDLHMLLYGISTVAHAALQQSVQKNAAAAAKRWLKINRAIIEADASLRTNGQPKIVLTDLALKM